MKKTKNLVGHLLARSEVAQIFQVSPSTITRWAESGKLPSVRTLGGHRRYEAKIIKKLVNNSIKTEANMQDELFSLPSMYSDHHVVAVRQALIALSGVEEVWASSAWQQVQVTYDPAAVSAENITESLKQAGYVVGDDPLPVSAPPPKKEHGWGTTHTRVTNTNQLDLEMSGDFRGY